MLDQDSVFE